ncbi:MAG: ABC transporter permease, partial [Chromatiales bacterium]
MKRIWLPVGILLLWALAALTGPWFAVEANRIDLQLILQGPGAGGLLGFDDLGRPILDRLIAGAR